MSNVSRCPLLRRSHRLSQQCSRASVYDDTTEHSCVAPNTQTPRSSLVHRSSRESRHPTKPPRPLNSFMCFRREYNRRRRLPDLNQCNISSRAAKEWRGMTAAEKEPYVQQAIRERADHAQKYPNYKYAPQKRGKSFMIENHHQPVDFDLFPGMRLVKREPEEEVTKPRHEEDSKTQVVKEEVQPIPPLSKLDQDTSDEPELDFVLTENIPELKLSDENDTKPTVREVRPTVVLHRAAFSPRTIIGFLTDFENSSRGSRSPTFDSFEFKWKGDSPGPNLLSAPKGTILVPKEDVFAEWIHEGMCGDE